MSDAARQSRALRRGRTVAYGQPRSIARYIFTFLLVGPGAATAAVALILILTRNEDADRWWFFPLLAVPGYLIGAVPAVLTALAAWRLSHLQPFAYVALTGLCGAAISALALAVLTLVISLNGGMLLGGALGGLFFGLIAALSAALLTLPRRLRLETVAEVFE